MAQKKISEHLAEMGSVLSLGILIGLCIAFGTIGGLLVDQWFACSPWGVGIGIMLGIASACVESYTLLTKTHKALLADKNRESK
jgi:F0F1-type ATP synthase assembly protein I